MFIISSISKLQFNKSPLLASSNYQLVKNMKSTVYLLLLSSLSIIGTAEKIVRKRKAAPLPFRKRKLTTVDFGRVMEEVTFDESNSYSFSYSYLFSYPESYDYSLNSVPSRSPTVVPMLVATSAPTSTPTAAPSLTLSDVLVTTTGAPTPFDENSNDTPRPTRSSSPTGSITNFPSFSPRNDQTSEKSVTNVTNTNGIVINGGDKQQQTASGSAILIPIVGIVTGMAILGAAVFAIDRRNGPVAYQNLDGDSQSSFSLA